MYGSTKSGDLLAIGGAVLDWNSIPVVRQECRGQPMRLLPPYRRWLFDHALQRLKEGLAPVVVLRGPRQVGKTTLQEQLIDHLLHKEDTNPTRFFRVQFDEIPSLKGLPDPVLSLSRWFEQHVLGKSFNTAARAGEPALLFLDEVQNLPDWAPHR